MSLFPAFLITSPREGFVAIRFSPMTETAKSNLELLSQACELFGLSIRSYTLMTNHVHLIAVPEGEDSPGKALRDTHGPYASYFNRRYGFCGHLWQARFHSSPMDDAHFWAAVRYVENNPVRSRMVELAQDYPWSSAAAPLRTA